ncbi:MAG TPA: hypothetical protein VGR35_17365 [Tepidisphaeraceae bacterium]|nr:hypothetical protein [Tepidisphaeraceae bacterium]
MAWYQATLWSLAAFRVLRMIVLCLLGTALITVALLPTDELGAAATVSNTALQLTLETRRGSLLLPAGTLLVMFFVMLTGALMGHIPAYTMTFTLTTILLTPLLLAVLSGSVAGMPLLTSADGSPAPFLSTKPMTDGDMILAKLASAALGCTLAWVVVLVLAPIWLIAWCDTTPLVRAWEHFSAMFPGRQRWLMLVLCTTTAWLLTWRLSVVNLYIALSGRAVLLTTYVIATIALAVAGIVLVCMELDAAVRVAAQGTVFRHPVILACILNVALVAKLVMAASSTSKGLLRGWTSGPTVGVQAAVWLGASGTVALTLYLLASHEPTLARTVPSLGLLAALCGLLLVPLARIALATQTLAENRHR